MIKKTIKDAERRLLSRTFLKRIKMERREMLNILNESDWRTAMSSFIEEEDFSAAKLLNCIKPAMDRITEEPSIGWLNFISEKIKAGMYPDSFDYTAEWGQVAASAFFMENYRFALSYERELRGFSPTDFMQLLTDEEVAECSTRKEYNRFKKYWKNNYIFEFIRLNREVTPYNTVGHISGVHHVATFVGKQLQGSQLPIDIALVSAAAACHDLGKFGCTPEEEGRIPYLHYYYTEKLLERLNMPVTSHIASNHSTWDLELENLSVESLLLIYADFRVKSTRENGVEKIWFYTLEEAFDVILSKLDNVDDKKRHRYEKVYAKLLDFENFIKTLGVETDIEAVPATELGEIEHNVAMLTSDETVENIKYYAIEHNIRMMSVFNNTSDFASLIESARTEGMWKNQRTYINIFSEYSKYMTKQEKLMTLNFLYELLSDKEGDIRRQAARLMGTLLATFDENYRKELPKHVTRVVYNDGLKHWRTYLAKILEPGHQKTEQHKNWIGYSLRFVLAGIVESASPESRGKYLEEFFGLFNNFNQKDTNAFILLDSAITLSVDCFEEQNADDVIYFAQKMSERKSEELKLATLRASEYLTRQEFISGFDVWFGPKNLGVLKSLLENTEEIINDVAEKSLVDRLVANIDNLQHREHLAIKDELSTFNQAVFHKGFSDEEVSQIYRDNLKTSTHWIRKLVNIDFLMEYVTEEHDTGKTFRFATHLANLIKVSDRVNVRYHAGNMLVKAAEMLPAEQINEIVLEMTKVLETGDYQFSKYVPEYLGQMALMLNKAELDEFISNLNQLIDNRNEKIGAVVLDTVGELIRNYPDYAESMTKQHQERITRLMGMLMKGYANYHSAVSQEAIWVIGQRIFDGNISLDNKFRYFSIIYKRLLSLTSSDNKLDMTFFTNAAALNCIYRFISDYIFEKGNMNLPYRKKVAFFPGTFDPFSLSHKGIVDAIRNKGFEVYLALDEFSWSKKTQPRMIRRKIITMSVADQSDVFLFPDNIPVNIANPNDLAKLKEIFKDRSVYMVAGSDVIINASSYKAEPEENSIHSLNHLIFKRATFENNVSSKLALKEAMSKISGTVEELKLPVYLEDISSTKIRDNIDNMRDIVNLIDPAVQNYIYDESLYLREDQYKNPIEARNFNFEILQQSQVGGILNTEWFQEGYEDIESLVNKYIEQNLVKIATIKSSDKFIAVALLSELETADIFNEFGDLEISAYLREKNPGKSLVIRGLMINPSEDFDRTMQMLLTEVFSEAIRRNCTYALYHPFRGKIQQRTKEIISLQGFLEIELRGKAQNIYEVSLKDTIAVIENMNTVLKSPFNTNRRMLKVLRKSHRKLQKALTELFPGNLVLSIDADVMNDKLIKMITRINGVPDHILPVRQLGPCMCVPFGKILHASVIPNTVTKAMHTEKIFTPALDSFTIEEYPMYAGIDDQVKTIKSFNRPVILVDDILHKGYRLQALDPIFKDNELKIEKIVTGILSGRGKDLMSLQGRDVESAYFLPNMRSWFVESTLYPFIGGDGVKGDKALEINMIPSVNLILPFSSPSFLKKSGNMALYDYSMTCLENTYEIFATLEEEYQHIFERQLTIRRLSEAINRPRIPSDSINVAQSSDNAPSEHVKNYIERLLRLKSLFV